jgi:4-hydroxy-tetrahydrodipicolinate reductase
MVNGLPGNVARLIAQNILADNRFELIPYALTGPEIMETEIKIGTLTIALLQPAKVADHIVSIKREYPELICIDYTHPTAVNANAKLYCAHRLPFVMGTTGGKRGDLIETVNASQTAAVIAPNMAKQIVGFQAMMAHAAENFPDLFAGYSLQIEESHQQGKADTSGTAKAMVTYFNKLGIPFKDEQIIQVRDPQVQQAQWGIPEAYLSGHGWHTYTLRAADETVLFRFSHNVNGRQIYVEGTLDAVLYLQRQLKAGVQGKVFSMIDVLKGG